jgi:putative ABC transport system permease protein
MIKHNLKTQIRNLTRNKIPSFINISGLIIGFTCFIFILMYIRFELSYDRYQPDSERIFRVSVSKVSKGSTRSFAINSALVATTLKDNFPDVEEACRIMMLSAETSNVRYGDRIFYERNIGFADEGLLNLFSLKNINGDISGTLNKPNTVLLTKQMAEKYFGNENPLGKILEINQTNYEVTAVVEDYPANTHLKMDIIASFKTREDEYYMKSWHFLPCYTYIKLAPHVNPADFEKKIQNLAHQYIGEELKETGSQYIYFLQPLPQIHLHSYLFFESQPPGNATSIYVFLAVGILILLIASMNFINLTTAFSIKRSREVALKKIVGAQRRQLFGQFMQESLFMCSIALFCAFLIVLEAIRLFNNLAGTNYRPADLFKPDLLLTIVGISLLIGIVSGIYPSLILSRHQPMNLFKGFHQWKSRRILVRKYMVVGQFALSIALLFSALVVNKQVNFMKTSYPGFDREQKLILRTSSGFLSRERNAEMKEEFLSHSYITEAASSSSVPGRPLFTKQFYTAQGTGQSMKCLALDHDFLQVYKIEMLAGRPFRLDDSLSDGYILNEAAVNFFGFLSAEEAIGKKLIDFDKDRFPILGVTRDFHWRGLQENIEPLIMYKSGGYTFFSLTVETENIRDTLQFAKTKYQEFFPGTPFEYFFLDADFNLQYRSEELSRRIIGIFTSLGLFIACLGLIGLTAFMAEQNKKEIGIRKVLGASVSGLVLLFSRDLIKWVLIANLFACPVAYYAANKWLQNFAYRINLGLWMFVASAAMALFFALFTVSYQSIKAATANPVDSLRYE